MESHSCTINRGEGVLGALPLPNPILGALPEIDTDDDSLRCRHIDALGRRCRMFVATPEITSADSLDRSSRPAAELCPHHAQRILRRHRATEATAAELLASVSDFTDPASVNRFLGNLIKLVAVKRIPRKNAVALAYISQLILNSQAAQDRRELMRLQIADLDAQRQKNLPTRVIWDLPVRRKPPQEQEAQEANAEKAGPSEAPQPSPAPAAPAASASAQTDNHATERAITSASASSGSARAKRLPAGPAPGRDFTGSTHNTSVRRGSSGCGSRPAQAHPWLHVDQRGTHNRLVRTGLLGKAGAQTLLIFEVVVRPPPAIRNQGGTATAIARLRSCRPTSCRGG